MSVLSSGDHPGQAVAPERGELQDGVAGAVQQARPGGGEGGEEGVRGCEEGRRGTGTDQCNRAGGPSGPTSYA